MRIKTRKWKEEKWIFCHEIFDFEEQSKQRSQKSVRKIKNKKKNKKGKERHLHNISSHGAFLRKKKSRKKERDGLMQRDVPRPRSMTTECTQTWLAHLRHDTQQWSRGLSIAHGILNACKSWYKFFLFFWREIFFLKKIRMIIFEHILFWIKICSLLKSSKENLFQKTIFLERAFVEKIFCLAKFKKKNERHQKKPNRKRKTRKTQQTKK